MLHGLEDALPAFGLVKDDKIRIYSLVANMQVFSSCDIIFFYQSPKLKTSAIDLHLATRVV